MIECEKYLNKVIIEVSPTVDKMVEVATSETSEGREVLFFNKQILFKSDLTGTIAAIHIFKNVCIVWAGEDVFRLSLNDIEDLNQDLNQDFYWVAENMVVGGSDVTEYGGWLKPSFVMLVLLLRRIIGASNGEA